MREYVGIVLSPVGLDGGKLELTKYGEELYDRGELVVGSTLMVEGKNSKHVVLVTNVTESNVVYELSSVFQAIRKLEGEVRISEGGVDLRQVVMEFTIIGEIIDGKLDRASRPPSPGAKVRQLTEEDREDLFGGFLKGYEDLERFKFGTIIGSRGLRGIAIRPRINMHLGIVGTTGSGKSFTAGAILEALARFGASREDVMKTSVFVFDVHGEYAKVYGDPYAELDGRDRGSYRDEIVLVGLNPESDEYLRIGIDFILEEDHEAVPLYTEEEFVSLVQSVYRASGQGVYRSLIREIYTKGLAQELHRLAESDMSVEEKIEAFILKAKELMMSESSIKPSQNTISAAERALRAFAGTIMPYLSTVDRITPNHLVDRARKHSLVIFDLSYTGSKDVDIVVKDILISYVLRVLYTRLAHEFFEQSGELKRLVFLIDEAQNFIPARGYDTGAVLTKGIVRKIASQGRKFGFSLILISQRPAFLDQHVFSLMNSLIVHRTAIGDAEYITKTFGLSRGLARALANQRTGEAFVYGQMFEIPMRIRIVKGVDRKIIEEI